MACRVVYAVLQSSTEVTEVHVMKLYEIEVKLHELEVQNDDAPVVVTLDSLAAEDDPQKMM